MKEHTMAMTRRDLFRRSAAAATVLVLGSLVGNAYTRGPWVWTRENGAAVGRMTILAHGLMSVSSVKTEDWKVHTFPAINLANGDGIEFTYRLSA